MKLVEYRDAGMHTYTYFWTDNNRHISPFFESEVDAQAWMREHLKQMITSDKNRKNNGCMLNTTVI